MKKILIFLLSFIVVFNTTIGQPDNVSKTVKSGDDLTINVKFDKMKLSKEDYSAQSQVNSLLSNGVKTTEVLSDNISKLTDAITDGVQANKLTKADIVAKQMNVSKEVLNKAFRRNNAILTISLIPILIFVFWIMIGFLRQKRLEVNHLLFGTVTIALYGIIASGAIYIICSFIFNRQYFIAKDLMSSLF